MWKIGISVPVVLVLIVFLITDVITKGVTYVQCVQTWSARVQSRAAVGPRFNVGRKTVWIVAETGGIRFCDWLFALQ